jgi:hypothetical protein
MKKIRPKWGETLTIEYFFSLARNKIAKGQDNCNVYSFYTDQKKRYLIGYTKTYQSKGGSIYIEDGDSWLTFKSIKHWWRL